VQNSLCVQVLRSPMLAALLRGTRADGHRRNFAAFSMERHLYSAGRLSRWASAHILVVKFLWPPCVADADAILLPCGFFFFCIHGSVINWFKSYLSSRSFHVRCNNTFSSFYTSSRGVPQGSVLGPLLFIMYTTPSALSSPPFPLTITFIQTTPNCSSHFTRPTSTQASSTCKMPFIKSLPG